MTQPGRFTVGLLGVQVVMPPEDLREIFEQ
jgi:hypothetical protein